jgi:hypothetical protein
LKLRGEKGTEQVCFVFAEFSFREVRDEDAFIVHYETEIDSVPHLAQMFRIGGLVKNCPTLF